MLAGQVVESCGRSVDESSDGGRGEARRGSSERNQMGVREWVDEWRESCREWERVHSLVCGEMRARDGMRSTGILGDPTGCDECKRERG